MLGTSGADLITAERKLYPQSQGKNSVSDRDTIQYRTELTILKDVEGKYRNRIWTHKKAEEGR